ncbi:MAG: folylpolyglutamate synthase/dihydrofolate synthase family protein [Candidatus Diapherotrites archaeon]
MNYVQAKNYLDSLKVKYKGFGLENMETLCKISNFDLSEFKVVHVAGSNGKGSVCAFVESVLRKAGYKTGLYTSPHLIEPTERIRVNGRKITKKDFAKVISITKEIAKKNKINITQFEALTFAALLYFKEKNVDVLIVEVGLGGRLDATNVLKGDVCAITTLTLEHTQYLGNTIEKIAKEKAGIIKENSFVVALKENLGLNVIISKCKEKNAKLFFPKFKIVESNFLKNQIIVFRPFKLKLNVSLLGLHQCSNAAIAVGICYALIKKGFRIKLKHIKEGIANARWQGRFEIVKKKPLIIFDVAHNLQGWEVLFKNISFVPHKKLFVIFGVMKDKNILGLKKLFPDNSQVYFCKPKEKGICKRALGQFELRKKIGFGKSFSSVKRALQNAIRKSDAETLIVVTGSFRILEEAYKTLKKPVL